MGDVSHELQTRTALTHWPPVLVRRTAYWLLCANVAGRPYFELYRRR